MQKRAARGSTGIDEVVMSFLRGEPPPERITKAQADAVASLSLLAAPEGCGVIGGRVVALPEGCSTDSPHWKAWLEAA